MSLKASWPSMTRSIAGVWSQLLSKLDPKSVSLTLRAFHIYPRRSPMVPVVPAPKIAGVLLCGLLLCLGPSNEAQAEHSPSASDVMKTDSQTDSGLGFQSDDDRQKNVDDKKGSTRAKGAKTIQGELVRVEDGNYF